MPKCALYARVSTVDKDQDPEVQLHLLRLRAESDGCEIYEEYVDEASGKDWNRPALLQMWSDARANRFKRIYILRLDRITRSMRDFTTILGYLDEKGLQLVSVKDVGTVDTRSPTGEFLLHVLMAFAQMEARLISERTKEALAKAKAEGKQIGREEVPIDVEDVLRRMREGEFLKDIAADLGVSKRTLQRRLARHRRGDNEGRV